MYPYFTPQKQSFIERHGSTLLNLAIVGSVAYGGYTMLQKVGLLDTKNKKEIKDLKDEAEKAEQAETTQTTKDNIEAKATDLRKLEAKYKHKSRSLAFFVDKADMLYSALQHSGISDEKDEAERIMKIPNNDLEIVYLVKGWNKRQLYSFSLPEGGLVTLPQAVASGELSKDQINRINKVYKQKKINYKW